MLGYNVPAFGAAFVAPIEGYSPERMASMRAEKRAEEFLIELARARGRFKKVRRVSSYSVELPH